MLHFLPQLVGRHHLEVLLPSHVSHLCFASLAVPGLARRVGPSPAAPAWGWSCDAAEGAEFRGGGTVCCPHPLSTEVQWLKRIPSLQSKSTSFPAKFSASFLFCFVANERELNCLNPSGKYFSATLYCKLVFQLLNDAFLLNWLFATDCKVWIEVSETIRTCSWTVCIKRNRIGQ